jgi:hypothetical protein
MGLSVAVASPGPRQSACAFCCPPRPPGRHAFQASQVPRDPPKRPHSSHSPRSSNPWSHPVIPLPSWALYISHGPSSVPSSPPPVLLLLRLSRRRPGSPWMPRLPVLPRASLCPPDRPLASRGVPVLHRSPCRPSGVLAPIVASPVLLPRSSPPALVASLVLSHPSHSPRPPSPLVIRPRRLYLFFSQPSCPHPSSWIPHRRPEYSRGPRRVPKSSCALHIRPSLPQSPVTSPSPPSTSYGLTASLILLDHQRATTATETTRTDNGGDVLDYAQTKAHQPGSGAPTVWLSRCAFFGLGSNLR